MATIEDHHRPAGVTAENWNEFWRCVAMGHPKALGRLPECCQDAFGRDVPAWEIRDGRLISLGYCKACDER